MSYTLFSGAFVCAGGLMGGGGICRVTGGAAVGIGAGRVTV